MLSHVMLIYMFMLSKGGLWSVQLLYFNLPFCLIHRLSLCFSQLAEQAGIPPGVVNVITSSRQNTPSVGLVLCEHPMVAKISFTGSIEVGKVCWFMSSCVAIQGSGSLETRKGCLSAWGNNYWLIQSDRVLVN